VRAHRVSVTQEHRKKRRGKRGTLRKRRFKISGQTVRYLPSGSGALA
jgi:hypothetical protein